MEEYIILVDEHKNILGTAPKVASHNAHTPLHLAFSVFLFNSKGEVLLQQRSHKKKTWPRIWSNSCCGHQKLNEAIAVTVADRVCFELNVEVKQVQIMLPNFRYRCERDGIVENEICPVFVGSIEETSVSFNKDEVENIRWIFWKDWVKEIEKHPEMYSYWAVEETKQLVNNNTFNNFLSSLSVSK